MKKKLYILLFTFVILCLNVKSSNLDACKEYSTFLIKTRTDLMGDTLIIPEGATIRFLKEGCLYNGTIVGSGTKIKGARAGIFENIKIKGEWNVPVIRSEYFIDNKEDDVLKQVFALSSERVDNKIYVDKGDYWVTATADDIFALCLKSNTELYNEGTIRIRPNNLISYAVIATCGENITINGGVYYGERDSHHGNKGEWGHGIRITEGSHKITVRNVSVYDCWGDGLAVEGRKLNTDILIDNFYIRNCRRQGISVIFARNCIIRNGYIANIHGTEPHLGIDIEPNPEGYCENIHIKNVFIESEKGVGIFTSYNEYQNRKITIEKCMIKTFGYACLRVSSCDGLKIVDNIFLSTAKGKNHVVVLNTEAKNCRLENNQITHNGQDGTHYCIFSSGKNVSVINNVIKSKVGFAFYTNDAIIEANTIDVPELMVSANNATNNVFKSNRLFGNVNCQADGNTFTGNTIAGNVIVKNRKVVFLNNKVKGEIER